LDEQHERAHAQRDGASHKRLLLLATISALGPAWLRFRHIFPAVPQPFVTFSLRGFAGRAGCREFRSSKGVRVDGKCVALRAANE
jgi:hypothetical protein